MISKLQYISQGNTPTAQFENIQKVLDHGCHWIQLRFKHGNEKEISTLAEKTKILCDTYSAILIINDNVAIAHQTDAHGVHLGLNDMKIKDARNILGHRKIIGGTANSFDNVVQRSNENCDYVGVGPFRFTATKEKLSPILGLNGYKEMLSKLKENNSTIPIFAIGGIQLNDIELLLETGIYGIAVSELLTQKPYLSTTLNEKLYVNI